MSQVRGEILGLHYSMNCETCETGYLAITKKHGTSIKKKLIPLIHVHHIIQLNDKREYKNQGHLAVRYEQAIKIRVCRTCTNIRITLLATIG